MRVLVELVRPTLICQGRDHRRVHSQPQAKRIVASQRIEIDALGIRQPAQQLVFAGMAEVDVMVDLGIIAYAQFDI